MLKIERGVPIPEHVGRGWRKSEAGPMIDKLMVGDSLLIPFSEGVTPDQLVHRIAALLYARKKKDGREFTQKRLPGENGVRVWRME